MSQFELVNEFIDVSKEDDLTKAVFGSLELLSTEALNEIFKQAALGVSVQSEPEFTFHETVNRREPDVIIEDGQNLTVMVEAKLDDHTRPNQLSDEYDDLIEGWSSESLRLWHVTDDSQPPRNIIDRTGIPPDDFLWCSWRDLASALLNVDSEAVNKTDQSVMAMLIQIFEDNGFAPFGGFALMKDSQSLSGQLEQAYQVRKQYYSEINSFRKDVESYLTEEVRFWRFFRRGVSGGIASGQKTFPTKSWENMPRNLWFSYIPRGDTPGRATRQSHENYLILDFNSRTGTIRAGYMMTTATGKVKDDVFRKILHEQRDLVLEIIRENQLQPYTTSYSLGDRLGPDDDLEPFLEQLGDSSYDDSEWGRRLLLTRTWSADELPTKDEGDELFEPAEVTKEVAGALNDIYQLTYYDYDHIFYPKTE
ncbi:hypothetical protein [Haloarchaeobius sp. HME9146]|uniref:hypothetical protein n=1 Tax=Haloarchaeobius sp. HME9146 TaxID=2978732 RepID=UPI0021C1538B|nr:hypothetical protein [Haloarchaeobius sp. HME9146]MCT9096974.1 hypothetical protein [Haloarchaeobius sp. HME9146]